MSDSCLQAIIVCGDDNDDPRAVELAKALSANSRDWRVYLYRPNIFSIWDGASFIEPTYDAVLPPGDVLFLHKNDSSKTPPSGNCPSKTVEFSGGGIKGERTQTYCPVEIPFSSGACPLSNSHLSAIRDWIRGIGETPVITHSDPVDHLVAVVVLCQGYLAAHFPDPAEDVSRDIRQALDTMGWTAPDMGVIATTGSTRLTDRERTQTEQPEWWQHVFGADRSRFREQLLAEVHHLRSDNEPGIRSLKATALDLENAIFGSTSIQDSDLVARFYSAAAAVLDEEAR